jgi:putative acetyltransferase
MITLKRTNSEDKDFLGLVQELDADLAVRDGDEHSFYQQYNRVVNIKYALVAYDGDIPVGCGALKEYSEATVEIKRMFVPPYKRGLGIASKILRELEKWALESDYTKCILETGRKQPEAIALYKKNGYNQIPNYGQYKNIENSVCFEKELLNSSQSMH